MSSPPIAREPEHIRAFVALDLDAASVRELARLSERLQTSRGAPRATWIPPPKIHLTLKFLGDAPTARVSDLANAAGPIVRATPCPRAAAIHVDGLPRTDHAQVIVAAVADPDGALGAIAQRVEEVSVPLGFAPANRPFRPHVTLARIKCPYDARRWLDAEVLTGIGDVRPACLVVYRSVLARDGSQYTPLARFGFMA